MKKRAQILSAAVTLFSQKGFNGVSTALIANKARVAEGLIYYHFKNKEGIFLAILETLMDQYVDEMEAFIETAESGLEAIERIVEFHFKFSKKRHKEFSVLIRGFPQKFRRYDSPYRDIVVSRVDRFFGVITYNIKRGIEDGSVRNTDPEKSAFLIRALFNGILYERVSGIYPVPDLKEEVVSCVRTMLGSSE